jgi:UDP-2-acetamido-2,6-beta-L-arabino-hexul-4-ose reductase
MNNILITGAKGFLGTVLRKTLLENKDVNILEFVRGDSIELLTEYVNSADFIFHFAGEVRPKSSDLDFYSSNVGLTEILVSLLMKSGKVTPILFTSTIHAINPKNTYGSTKRESEKIVEAYSKKMNSSVFIYRLPHVFGPGCKPNYNSIVSTWIYNSINGLEIKVFDRDIKMQYCYSQDIIDNFISHINTQVAKGCFYLYPLCVYNTSLGAVVDLIHSFQLGDYMAVSSSSQSESEFSEKMFITYQSYVEQ